MSPSAPHLPLYRYEEGALDTPGGPFGFPESGH